MGSSKIKWLGPGELHVWTGMPDYYFLMEIKTNWNCYLDWFYLPEKKETRDYI